MKKNILIIGATGGMGEAAARWLVSQGYYVILVGRNKNKLEAIAKELSPDAISFPYDLTDLYNIESIFKYVSGNNLKLDGMIHAAGINRDVAIRMNDINEMIEVTTVNYMSFVELMKFFIKKKYSNDGASVVAVSSIASVRPAPAMCTYAASKSALDSAVSIAAMEGVKRHIRVNAILPGGTDTEMLKDAGISKERIESIQPLGMIEPIDIAYLMEFLLSDKSRCITGAHIPVTGGNL